ncbi:hypothetical protein DPMN_094391 [Dreissena polymorpha]|uniref:Uncharacterized protein n=1 Tax=Dreissena polymorpha TaxID=45954 RepID=A0A9D4L5Y6_DREPO|nr:hypothetical protein DPMN_094391 [Dreissena polymorpha]
MLPNENLENVQDDFLHDVCRLRYWIRQFPVQFDLDSKLQSVIKAFGTLVQHKGNSTFRELIDLSKV